MKFFRRKIPKVGLALGSGAARGLAHIGVLKALKEASVPIDTIAGTSMGAMIGACFARDGEIAQVEELALKANLKQLTRLLDLNFVSLRKGLINGQRIEELLYSLIGDIEFEELKIPLAVVATDINASEEVVIRQGSVIDAVKASISIPAIFVPIQIKGRFLVDGGITNPVPTDVLQHMGAEYIIAVNVLANPHKRKPTQIRGKVAAPNIFSSLVQATHIMEYEIIKLRTLKANLVISPDVSHIEAFEFYKRHGGTEFRTHLFDIKDPDSGSVSGHVVGSLFIDHHFVISNNHEQTALSRSLKTRCF